MEAFDSTASRLCFPLVKYLQGRPLLDENAKTCLIEAKAEIDNALVFQASSSVLVRVKPKSFLLAKSPSAAKQNGKVVESTNTAGPLKPLPAEGNSVAKNRNQYREKKRRIIVAVRPYVELREVDNVLTVMEWLFGGRFATWYWRKKRVVGPLTWGMWICSWTCSLIALVLPGLPGEIAAGSSLFGNSILLLMALAVVNRKLLLTSLKTFEAQLFIVETSLLALTVMGTFCFTLSGCALGLSTFVALSTALLNYDSLPSSSRQRTFKWNLLGWCLAWPAAMAIIYFRLPEHMCTYRWDMEHGLLDENDLRRSKWGFSFREFFLNRGTTVLVLIVRATYLAFRYPQDCIFIRSRMRVIEVQMQNTTRADTDDQEQPPNS